MRIMSLALGALLLSPTVALAGKPKEPCKGVQLKKNKFGITRSFNAGDLKIRQAGGNTIIELALKVGGGYGGFTSGTAEQLPAETPIEILFEDGTTMELPSATGVGTRVVSVMGATVSFFDIPISVTDEQATEIGSKMISAYRVPSKANYEPADAKKGDAKKFAEALTCIVTNPVPTE